MANKRDDYLNSVHDELMSKYICNIYDKDLTFNVTSDGYEELNRILEDAVNVGAKGKGKVRHGVTKNWHEQPIIRISEMLNSPVGPLYQVIKKCQETARYEDPQDAINEMYGAIVYAAAAIKFLELKRDGDLTDDKIPSKQQGQAIGSLNDHGTGQINSAPIGDTYWTDTLGENL